MKWADAISCNQPRPSVKNLVHALPVTNFRLQVDVQVEFVSIIKNNRFNKQNNNFASASSVSAGFARLRRENF